MDSLLEGGRFEPSVPLAKESLCGGTGNAVRRKKQTKSVPMLRGTEGSNLPSSSGESVSNLRCKRRCDGKRRGFTGWEEPKPAGRC